MQDNIMSSGKRSERSTLFISTFLHWANFLRQPGRDHGPSTLALKASQRHVYRELAERVNSVIVTIDSDICSKTG